MKGSNFSSSLLRVLMMELALPYKSTHREAVTQKDLPNAAFDLPNGRKWAPRLKSRKHQGALPARPNLNFFKPRIIPDAFPAQVVVEQAEPFIPFVRRDIYRQLRMKVVIFLFFDIPFSPHG